MFKWLCIALYSQQQSYSSHIVHLDYKLNPTTVVQAHFDFASLWGCTSKCHGLLHVCQKKFNQVPYWIQWVPGLFAGSKAAEAWYNHPIQQLQGYKKNKDTAVYLLPNCSFMACYRMNCSFYHIRFLFSSYLVLLFAILQLLPFSCWCLSVFIQ